MTTDTLNTRLDGTKDGLAEVAPPEIFGVFAAEQTRLEATTDRAATVAVGDTFPSVTLPDANGKPLAVSGPAVVVFYRGAWCPYCNVALKAYQDEVLPAIDIPLYAISPQGSDGSLTIAEKNDLSFAVLTDAGSELARKLGIVFALTPEVQKAQIAIGNDFETINANGEWELPMPTVLVIDAAGKVTFADVHPDYTTRTEPAAIIEAVRAL